MADQIHPEQPGDLEKADEVHFKEAKTKGNESGLAHALRTVIEHGKKQSPAPQPQKKSERDPQPAWTSDQKSLDLVSHWGRGKPLKYAVAHIDRLQDMGLHEPGAECAKHLRHLDGTGGCQARIDELKRQIQSGVPMPPAVVFRSGRRGYVVQDGNHRVAAARQLGLEHIPVLMQQTIRKAETDATRIPKKRNRSETLVASVAAFNEDGQLLFGLRSDTQKWTLPGGHLEEGEEPLKGAVRELYEEAGLKPLSISYLGHGVVRRGAGDVRVFCFKATVTGTPTGENDPDQECQTWRFVDVKDGIPDDINDHLFNKNNITLRLLGLQEGEIRKFEQKLVKAEGDPTDAESDRLYLHSQDYFKRFAPPEWELAGQKSWNDYPTFEKEKFWRNYFRQLGAQAAQENAGPPPTTDSYTKHFWDKPEADVVDDNLKAEEWGRYLHVLPDYDNPPPFLDKTFGAKTEALWPEMNERERRELWDSAFRQEQAAVRNFGLDKYLKPTKIFEENTRGEGKLSWNDLAPFVRWEHLDEQAHVDSRRPDEDDIEFNLRAPSTREQMMALDLPGVEPRHLDLALKMIEEGKVGAGGSKIAGKIVEHPLVEERHLGKILTNPDVNIVYRAKALKHPKMGRDGLEPFVERIVRSVYGDNKKPDPRLLDSEFFVEHPALGSDQMKRLLSPTGAAGEIPLGEVRAGSFIKQRRFMDPGLLSDLALRPYKELRGTAPYSTAFWVAEEALKHPNMPHSAIDQVLEDGLDAHKHTHDGYDPRQIACEKSIAARSDLTGAQAAEIANWKKRFGATNRCAANFEVSTPRQTLFKNKDAPITDEHLNMGAEDPSHAVRQVVAKHPNVKDEHLRKMLPYRESWRDIADSPCASTQILDELFQRCKGDRSSDSEAVLIALATNPGLSRSAISEIASDPRMYDAWPKLAENPNVTADNMVEMARASSHTRYSQNTFSYALRNHRSGAENQQTVPWIFDPELRHKLVSSGVMDGLDDDDRSKFYSPHNESVSAEELNDILLNKPSDGSWWTTKTAAAEHPNLPVETVRKIITTPGWTDQLPSGAVYNLLRNRGLTMDDLHGVLTSAENSGKELEKGTLGGMFHHPAADDFLRGRILTANPHVAEDMLMHAPDEMIAPHLRMLIQSPYDNVRAQAIAHKLTPQDVVEKAALNDPSGRVRKFAVQTDRLPLDIMRQIATNDPEEYVRKEALASLSEHDPDSVFDKKVQVKLGLGKVRKVRDIILATGKDRARPKDLPPGDWSVGRGPDGNIHAAKLQEFIDKAQGMPFNLSHDTWDGAQRHSNEFSKVLQVNLTTDQIEKMKTAGVYDTFRNMQEASKYSGHPIHPNHGIGWIRYTQSSDPIGPCSECDGDGKTMVDADCSACDGRGWVLEKDKDQCGVCEGSGQDPDEEDTECGNCEGTGEVEIQNEVSCNHCEGNGTEKIEDDCDRCGGDGSVTGYDGVAPPRAAYNNECELCGKNSIDDVHTKRERCKTCDRHEDAHREDHSFVPGQRLTADGKPIRGTEHFCATCEDHEYTHHKFDPKSQPGTHHFTAMKYLPDEFFIDEVQSDFGQSFVRQAAAQARQEGLDEDEAVQRAEEKYPEEHFKAISKILFNGKHPNEILHEAFQQHLRDLGHHSARVSVHTVESKAPISLGRSLGKLCETCGKPEDHDVHYSGAVDHEFKAHPDGPGIGCMEEGHDGVRCMLAPVMHVKGAHTYIPGKEVNRLAAPGHFNVSYNDIPKKLGMEPSHYGTMKTHKPDAGEVEQDAPLWEGKVRKFEEPLSKMAVIHDDAQNPMTVYRVQTKEGHGPYSNTNKLGFDRNPEKEREWFQMPSPGKGNNFINTPIPENDFDPHENDLIVGGRNPNVLFGFRSPDEAEKWFGREWLDRAKDFGFDIVPMQARRVYGSKTGSQIMFEPHGDPKPINGDTAQSMYRKQWFAGKDADKTGQFEGLRYEPSGYMHVDIPVEHLAHAASSPDRVNEYMGHIQRQGSMGPSWGRFDDRTGKVVLHDGNHRAAAHAALGHRTVRVMIPKPDHDRYLAATGQIRKFEQPLIKSGMFSQAAFRHKATGDVVGTGSFHDVLQLPGKLPEYDEGFLGHDGKFYTREEAQQALGRNHVVHAHHLFEDNPSRKHWESVRPEEFAPVRKFEDDLAIWLATQPLAKMAVKPEDLKPVAKYHSDEGANFVDHTKEANQHPGEHEAYVSAFKAHVLDNPETVKRGKTGTHTASNSTGKVVYNVEDEWMGGQRDHRFMVKPYHEKIVPRAKQWMQFPIQGWAEMTNQALYHAGGIGDLHQKVHVAMVPMQEPQKRTPRASKDLKAKRHEIWLQVLKDIPLHGPVSEQFPHGEFYPWLRQPDGTQVRNPKYSQEAYDRADKLQVDTYHERMRAAGVHYDQHEHAHLVNPGPVAEAKTQPALVIHMQPDVGGGIGLLGLSHGLTDSPEIREGSKKIALMDFLTNNLDRHRDNLLWDSRHDRFFAIDHSRSFQYRNTNKGKAPKQPIDDMLKNYISRSEGRGGNVVAHSAVDPIPWRRTGSGPNFDQRQADQEYWKELDRYNGEWKPVFDWWEKNAPAIKQAMEKRLDLIKDANTREHVRRNFNARWEHLNNYARDGFENYGGDLDWMNAPVPLYRFGTNDHE